MTNCSLSGCGVLLALVILRKTNTRQTMAKGYDYPGMIILPGEPMNQAVRIMWSQRDLFQRILQKPWRKLPPPIYGRSVFPVDLFSFPMEKLIGSDCLAFRLTNERTSSATSTIIPKIKKRNEQLHLNGNNLQLITSIQMITRQRTHTEHSREIQNLIHGEEIVCVSLMEMCLH